LTLAGYDTVLAGKMHFVGPDQLHGFSRRFNTNVYHGVAKAKSLRDWRGSTLPG